ncbi:VCBS domain-containing protein, partial [Amphritea balenae]
MADKQNFSTDSVRDKATEDLFNRDATAHINPNRRMSEDIHGRDDLSPEELFKQNIQGRIDHGLDDKLLPELESEGFEFVVNDQLLSAIESDGVLPEGTVIATLSVPVEGADFSFQLSDSQFAIVGDQLVLSSNLLPQVGELFALQVSVSSNTTDFSLDVPLSVNFDGLAELVEESFNFVPTDIELSNTTLDEDAQGGDFVANLIAVDSDNVDGFEFELTGVGAELFEIQGHQLIVKEGSEFDFETLAQHSVEVTVTDPAGNSYTEVVTIDLNDINETPVLSDAAISVTEGGDIAGGALEAEDPDFADQLSFMVADGFTLPPGFELAADGDYSFDPTNSAYDHLAIGDSQILAIPIKVVDSGGLESSAEIVITISGSNDGPVADADVIAVTDEGDQAISGQLVASDVDDAASLNFSVTGGADLPAGFTLESDGSYSFNPADDAYQSMDAGDTQVLTIPVTVTDDQGATDTQQIQVTVTGTNDAPVAGADVTASVDEGDSAISGQLTASDVDDAASLSFSVTGGADLPAGFTLESDGSYSFNPADAAYESMDAGDTQVLTIPVTVTDEQGATDTQQIQVTVTGTNDAPVAGADVTASVDEGDAAISGQLSASDVDDSASLSFSVTGGADLPAGFTLESDGSYSFNPSDDAYQSMDAGDTQVLTIPVTVTDDQGATDTQQIQVTVTGTNDAPVAGADVTASVDEGDSAISGQLSASDVDDAASLSFSVTGGADLPAGFTLESDGSYSFNPADDAYQSMDASDTQVLTIPVTVTDEQGATDTQQIQVTVTGTNDAPVAGADVTASVDEGDAAISGQLTASDVDDAASLSFSVTGGADLPAGFTLESDGSYSFNPADDAYQSMDAGDTQVLTIPVTVTDEQGATDTQQIQVTVTGTNDAPVAGADVTASVDEGDAAISGQLTASDVDDAASLSFSVTGGADLPAGFTLESDGSYSFNPADDAYQSMDAGDTQVLTIPVTVTDDQGATDTQQIQVTVTGTNDAPVAGADVTASVDEGDAAISGQLSASDVDDAASLSFSVTGGADLPAGFTLESDGSYSFNPADDAYQSMDAGDTQVLTIPVTVTDDQGATDTQQIQVTVTGTNDAPVAGADVTASVDEGDAAISGQLTASDVDDAASLSFSVTGGADLPAGFTLESDGSYSFNPADAAYESMDAGDTQVLTIPVTVTDDQGATDTQQIQVTVTGTNDAPVAGADVTASVDEGDAAISGQLSASDVDDAASLSFSVTGGADLPAGFTLESDGSYSFNPADDAYQSMDAGDTQVLTIPVTVTDDQGATDTQQIQVTVTGTNDAPVAGADVTASVDEGDAAISGQLSASDVDDAASLSFSVTGGADLPAGFTLESDGSYSFNPADDAYQSMDAGDTQVLTIPVTVTDEQGATDTQQIQVTVTGTNDAPVAGADVTASVDEGDTAISGQLAASDVDDAASLSFSVTGGADLPAGFTLESDGSYSFNPADDAYQSMDAGDTQVLTIPVTVTDDQGATDTQQIQVTVTGTNDAPVAGADVTASVDEGDAAISGQLTASDVDDAASLSFSVTGGADLPAGFTLESDGSYSFNPADDA